MLTDEDRAVLAHLVVDPDAWIAHALATVGPKAVLAKCRRDIHVAAYRAAMSEAEYKPRGKLPSKKACASVVAALSAIDAETRKVAAAKAAQQDRINKLFTGGPNGK
jgi:hypothetical protein